HSGRGRARAYYGSRRRHPYRSRRVNRMADEKVGWLGRLKAGLGRTSQALGRGLDSLFGGQKADAKTLQDLEDLLITADLGVATAGRLAKVIAKERFDEATAESVREGLAREIETILAPVARPLE